MSDLNEALVIASSGMRAQTSRMKLLSENLANAQSTALDINGDPYRRKVMTFKTAIDEATGAAGVAIDRVSDDPSAFQTRYDPAHPNADARGYVRMPNVNTLIEMMDMREAQRSYEANVSALELAKSMMARTIDLLRS